MPEDFQPQSTPPPYPMPVPPGYAVVRPVDRAPRLNRGGAIWLLVMLVILLILPTLIEHLEYSYARGKERAEAEVAKELLETGKETTVSAYRFVVKAVIPSVVGVKASRIVRGEPNDELSYRFGRRPAYRQQDQGSGVIVDASSGRIVTNYHVVDHASEVAVELNNGSRHNAKIIGVDPLTDMAVLQIQASGLIAAPWGDSDAMEVGDPVLAIGNPFTLARTVTAGIISAKGRRVKDVNTSLDFLQTDAAVNPGNSGGPLVNMKGQVIGINTAIVGPTYQGISFAIPSNLVHKVYEQLISAGKVARGWLGVSMQELTPELAERLELKATTGALVSGIVPHSPAALAGLKPGDVITRWNGKAIEDPTDLGLAVASTKIGTKATITIVREGREQTLTITVAERPDEMN